jgi:methionyl-tRNA formyltransferase
VNIPKLRIVFMGTSSFAVPALEALHLAGETIAAVVTQPDRARGRGGKTSPTPVGGFAEENGMLLLKPERLKDNGDFARALTEAAPDLIVVASYGKLLPKALLDFPPLGCVNIHASLLPEYRGAAPIQRALLDGKKETGVTLMYMGEGLDAGDMIAAARTETADMNAGMLTDRLARLGAGLLLENMQAIADGTAPRVRQDAAKATYAEKIGKAEGHIDPAAPTDEAVRRVRAMNPAPGAYLLRGGARIGVTKARAVGTGDDGMEASRAAYETAAPGTVLSVSNMGISVRTGDGVLLIEELQMPGKRAMAVADYLKGNAFGADGPLS